MRGLNGDDRGLDMCRQCFREKVGENPFSVLSYLARDSTLMECTQSKAMGFVKVSADLPYGAISDSRHDAYDLG